MPLVAGVLGVLAYYSLTDEQRRKPAGRAIGWGSVLIGVLFHPYFLLYWPVIAVFTAWEKAWVQHQRVNVRQLVQHANPKLLIVGASIGLILALATWLRGNIEQSVPWDQWLGSPLPTEILTALFWPFFDSGWLGALSAAILVLLLLAARPGSRGVSPAPALVLIGLAAALTLVVSAASILAEFWVFPRQWVASQALVLVALPWLASTLLAARKPGRAIRWAALWLAAFLLLPAVITTGLWKVSQLWQWNTNPQTAPFAELSEGELAGLLNEGGFPSNRTWMEFSQANLLQGGNVWPTLGRYYTDMDWSTITLQQPPRQELFLEDVNP